MEWNRRVDRAADSVHQEFDGAIPGERDGSDQQTSVSVRDLWSVSLHVPVFHGRFFDQCRILLSQHAICLFRMDYAAAVSRTKQRAIRFAVQLDWLALCNSQ